MTSTNKSRPLPNELYELAHEVERIGNRAVQKAQEENRKRRIPNVYSINGILYYELPNGELTRDDPYRGPSESNTTQT